LRREAPVKAALASKKSLNYLSKMRSLFWSLLFILILLGPVPASATFRPVCSQFVVTTATSVAVLPETHRMGRVASQHSTSNVSVRKKSFFSRIRRLLPDTGKSKVAAALLALFLGTFGVHRFYLGHHRSGLIQLLLTSLGLLLAIVAAFGALINPATAATAVVLIYIGSMLLVSVSLWAFVDFIRILIDDLTPKEGAYEEEA
jgi:TM2 domain-containing membrane protein YozV